MLTNEGALNKYDPKTRTFSQVVVGNSPASLKSAHTLVQDRQKQYWAGTLDMGLLRFDGQQTHRYQHEAARPLSLSHNQVRAVLNTRLGAVWVGTDGGGLNIYDPLRDGFTHVRADETTTGSLSSDAVYSLYEDRAGTLWVGTFGGGVNFYSPYKAKFAHYAHLPRIGNSLSQRSVLTLHEDADGNIWMGTDGGGLDMFDPRQKTFRHFRHDPADPNSLSSNVVKALYEDKEGNLWVGTYLGGLNRYDREHDRFIHYNNEPNNPNSLANNVIWRMYEDSRRQLWVSTLGVGLCVMDRGTGAVTRFKPVSGPGSLNDYNVVTMLEDRGGRLWMGTEDQGLDLYRPQSRTFSYVRHDPKKATSLSSNRIQVLFEDHQGRLWVGTADNGLNLLNPDLQSFRHFTTADGLPSNVINAIEEDKEGNLWISTNKGICRFDVRGRTFKNFDREDGLQSNEFNINAALRARSGKLYFGGINGFNVFAPTALMNNPNAPPVVLTDLQVFNTSVKAGAAGSPLGEHISEAKTLTLSYKESAVTFQFAALNFIDPQKNHYAYQLTGFDEEWRYCGTRHEATYTNLDPGTYVFRVKAANNDGVWNLTGTALTVIVTPPWWKTAWFRVLATLAVLGGAAAFYVARTTAIRKKLLLEQMRALRTKEAELREARLTHEKAVVEMSKARLETAVLHKNSELAASVMSIVHQNETLLIIKDGIKEAIDNEDVAQQRKKMQRIVRLIDREVTPDQHWNHFEELFNQLHENFMQRLRQTYPQLTSRDLKLCAYLRMNLDSKEIASLMGLSVRGIEDLRYRVRKKMELNTGINLLEFILEM